MKFKLYFNYTINIIKKYRKYLKGQTSLFSQQDNLSLINRKNHYMHFLMIKVSVYKKYFRWSLLSEKTHHFNQLPKS